MRIIINSSKYSSTSVAASTRNAKILSDELNIPMISTYEECEQLNASDYHCFIVVGSMFYPETARIERWIRSHRGKPNIVWINNEYRTTPNSEYYRLMKDYHSIIIANTESIKSNRHDEFHLVNLNALMFHGANEIIHKELDHIYFGTYRPGRRLYFQKYFKDNLFHIASNKKNLKQFYQLAAADGKWLNTLNFEPRKESLNLFRFSLYLEDEHTHENYHHLANRFYECLNCNVVQFFDVSCMNTITQSNFEVDPYFIVSSFEEYEQRATDWEALYERQLGDQVWFATARKEKEEALQMIDSITRNCT